MKCYNCGNTLLKKKGTLQVPSEVINDFLIEKVTFFSCSGCDEIILSDDAWAKADLREAELINESIMNLPLCEFVGASQAASILEISRQALHKHRRIRRGFVYFIKHEGKNFYHKESLILFKESGDGRFNLTNYTKPTQKEYIIISQPSAASEIFFTEESFKNVPLMWTKMDPTPVGQRYAN